MCHRMPGHLMLKSKCAWTQAACVTFYFLLVIFFIKMIYALMSVDLMFSVSQDLFLDVNPRSVLTFGCDEWRVTGSPLAQSWEPTRLWLALGGLKLTLIALNVWDLGTEWWKRCDSCIRAFVHLCIRALLLNTLNFQCYKQIFTWDEFFANNRGNCIGVSFNWHIFMRYLLKESWHRHIA